MAEIVSAVVTTIEIIRACVDKYYEFSAFEDECETFRQSLVNVANVLDDVKTELDNRNAASAGKGSSSGNTSLRRPLKLLKGAVDEGGKVLKKCSSKKRGKLRAFVFSRQYMGMLNTARADIREAMRLLQFSSVKIQLTTQRMMDNVSLRLEELDQKIIALSAGHNDVAESILHAVQMRNSSGRDGTADANASSSSIRDALVRVGAANDDQDVDKLLAVLQKEAESIRQNDKAVYDEEMLAAVLALTAPRDEGRASETHGARARESTTTASAVLECMICPIMGEIMLDPVTVVESSITYDRENLCTSLLSYPDLDPATGRRFDQPLHYIPNFAVRSMITAQYGDSYYQRYDDQDFKAKYEAMWRERLHPPSSGGGVVLEDRSVGGAEDEIGGGEGFGGGGSDGFSGLLDSRADVEAGRQWGEPAPGSSDLRLDDFNRFPGASIAGSVVGSDEISQLPNVASDHHGISNANEDSKATKPGASTPPRVDAGCRKSMLSGAAAVVVVVIIVVVAVFGAHKSTPAPSAGPAPGATNPSPSPGGQPANAPTSSSSASILDKFNAALPAKTMASLQDPSTAQYRAYEWVTQSDQVPEQEEPNDEESRVFRMTQRFALATVLYSFNGYGQWVNSTVSECDWGNKGRLTECVGNRVVAVVPAGGNGQNSSLPPEVGLLTNLATFDLEYLELTSSIPTELGQLSALTYIRLSYNALTSSIPTELGQLSALTVLDLGLNALTSSIPTELGQLSALKYLDLHENALTSSIPTELGRLSALWYLDLSSNALTSSIPTELGQLANLDELILYVNALTGTVPSSLCDVSNLFVGCGEINCTCCGCP